MSDSLDSFYQIKSILIFFFLLLSFSFSSLVICLCSLQEVTLLLYPLCFFFFSSSSLSLSPFIPPLDPLLCVHKQYFSFTSLLKTFPLQTTTNPSCRLFGLSLIVLSHEILKLEGGKNAISTRIKP